MRYGSKVESIMLTKVIVIAAILISSLYMFSCSQVGSKQEAAAATEVDIYYFYFNPCASCDVEKEFQIRLDTLLGEDIKHINLRMFNAFYSSVEEKLLQFFEQYYVLEEHREAPILFLGDTYIQGSANIDRNLKYEFDKARSSSNVATPQLQESEDIQLIRQPNVRITDEEKQSRIIYFYVPLCAECDEVENFFNTLNSSYYVLYEGQAIKSRLEIEKYNISTIDNLEMLRRYFDEYRIPDEDQQVPILFIGDKYLKGYEEIKGNLVNLIEAGQGILTPLLLEMPESSENALPALTRYEIAGVLTTGLINGVNPCSISMLLFFLSTAISKSNSILKMGLSFILGRFLTYVLLGTLLFNLLLIIDVNWMQQAEAVMKVIVIMIVLFFAVYNIRDYFAAKGEKYDQIKLQLPVALRRMNHNWIKKFTAVKNTRVLVVLSFLLGILISIGEFLCTGQIYLLTIIYMMHDFSQFNLEALAWFLIYGIGLIIPMLLLLFVLYKGREVFDVSEFARSKLHYVKLINAAVFVVFGLIVLFVF